MERSPDVVTSPTVVRPTGADEPGLPEYWAVMTAFVPPMVTVPPDCVIEPIETAPAALTHLLVM